MYMQRGDNLFEDYPTSFFFFFGGEHPSSPGTDWTPQAEIHYHHGLLEQRLDQLVSLLNFFQLL